MGYNTYIPGNVIMKHPVWLSSTNKNVTLFYKKKAKEVLSEGDRYQCVGKDIRKRCRKVTMVEIFCTHVCKWKNETC
jgi:hypothetical protein